MTWWPTNWWPRSRHHESDDLREAKERLERVLADDSTVDQAVETGARIVRENGLVWNIERALRVRRL